MMCRHDRPGNTWRLGECASSRDHRSAAAADRKPMNTPPAWSIVSAIPGIGWPAIPSPGAGAVLALLDQLEQTQWLPAVALVERQLAQLQPLLRHAHANVPWYRRAWAGRFDPAAALRYDTFAALPLLTRRDVQENFDALRSARMPNGHGELTERRTSGSTGAPVRFLSTGLASLFWNAFTLRDHRWQHRDLAGKLAVVRRETEPSAATSWGPATAGVVATGPAVAHSIRADVDTLLDWLHAEQPEYLYTYPSLVRDLALQAQARGVVLSHLREVRTLAESLPADLRELVQATWRVPVTDVYSASETGYLALQCPEQDHYHVQAEGVLLEILNDHGAPCGPGEVGRVVVTALHNFAMPLLRYDIGDYAEVGAACPCGRGLPVLTRILGRVRNTLVTADGKRYWPAFGTRALMEVAPIRQHQFVQKTVDLIEARLVVATPLTQAQEQAVRERIASQLPSGMQLSIVYRERLERSASGKFEDFLSEIG
jgi:phenylacetate-coenzyme A ligase PaaK-like adenylate-forming protein